MTASVYKSQFKMGDSMETRVEIIQKSIVEK